MVSLNFSLSLNLRPFTLSGRYRKLYDTSVKKETYFGQYLSPSVTNAYYLVIFPLLFGGILLCTLAATFPALQQR